METLQHLELGMQVENWSSSNNKKIEVFGFQREGMSLGPKLLSKYTE
ncbi:unnamed protein product [Paramecium octaurelia]|uniref:Uncharacterized protein n=1 Tax=Paramecium octaurelia TaxID=43137 RepID=A0A8S1T511_PAROT|nr:unnamed protein product [Paramecium octaurelia]